MRLKLEAGEGRDHNLGASRRAIYSILREFRMFLGVRRGDWSYDPDYGRELQYQRTPSNRRFLVDPENITRRQAGHNFLDICFHESAVGLDKLIAEMPISRHVAWAENCSL